MPTASTDGDPSSTHSGETTPDAPAPNPHRCRTAPHRTAAPYPTNRLRAGVRRRCRARESSARRRVRSSATSGTIRRALVPPTTLRFGLGRNAICPIAGHIGPPCWCSQPRPGESCQRAPGRMHPEQISRLGGRAALRGDVPTPGPVGFRPSEPHQFRVRYVDAHSGVCTGYRIVVSSLGFTHGYRR